MYIVRDNGKTQNKRDRWEEIEDIAKDIENILFHFIDVVYCGLQQFSRLLIIKKENFLLCFMLYYVLTISSNDNKFMFRK